MGIFYRLNLIVRDLEQFLNQHLKTSKFAEFTAREIDEAYELKEMPTVDSVLARN